MGDGMMIDLRKLDDTAGTVTSDEMVRFEDGFGEDVSVDCSVDLSYQHNGGAYYFHGKVTASFNTSCHRCLEPVEQPLEGEFDVVVRVAGAGVEVDDTDETGEFITLAAGEHEVDFTDVIHENVVVNVPMLIVCDDDCRGLCPQCGTNLNRASCSCEQTTDARWDALRGLGTKNAEE